MILNNIEVKPIRTRKQINKKEKIRKNIQRIKNNGKTKVSLKTKKQIVVCVYLFSWKKTDQAKGKPNLTKKMLFTSFKIYSRKQYSKKGNSDIVADTQTTQAKKTCKNTAKMKLQYSELYFSPDISKRSLVKSINNKKVEKVRSWYVTSKKNKLFLFLLLKQSV